MLSSAREKQSATQLGHKVAATDALTAAALAASTKHQEDNFMGCGCRFEPAEWWAEAARRSCLPNGKFPDTRKVPKAGDVVRPAKYSEPELVQVWDVNNLAHMEDIIAKTLVMPYMSSAPMPRRKDPLSGRDSLLFTVPRNDLAVNMDQCLTLSQSAKDMAFTKDSVGVKELSRATESILEAQNTILDMTRVMINENMRRVQVLSDPDRHSEGELEEAEKECMQINSWMLSAANQQACITMSKITELLGAKARGQEDGPKENLLNASQVMSTVTTDVDKLAQQRKSVKKRFPSAGQSGGGGVSGRGTACPPVSQPEGSPKSNDSDSTRILSLTNQVRQLKEANLGLRSGRGSAGSPATGATGNRPADAGKSFEGTGKPSPSKNEHKRNTKGKG